MPREPKPGRKDEQFGPITEELSRACQDELAAVEFIEARRWGGAPPACLKCGTAEPYMMKGRDGARNRRFLWRCRECGVQFTCRTGTVFEDSKLPLKDWCRAFWMASSLEKGVSALQLHRTIGCTAKTALFVLQRLRFAMLRDDPPPSKLAGLIMADEAYVAGKPRHERERREKWWSKAAVIAVLQPGGEARAKHVPAANKKESDAFILANVDLEQSHLMTNNTKRVESMRRDRARLLLRSNDRECHAAKECSRDGVTTNDRRVQRSPEAGLYGTWHSVSKARLGLYVGKVSFRWNHRKVNDGEGTEAAIRAIEGKRLTRAKYLRSW